MSKTVTKEQGKTDKIADGAGSVTTAPESNAEKGPTGRDGWINGQPATAEEIEKSTR